MDTRPSDHSLPGGIEVGDPEVSESLPPDRPGSAAGPRRGTPSSVEHAPRRRRPRSWADRRGHVEPLGPTDGWSPLTWLGLIALGTVADLLRPLNPGQRFAFSSEDGAIFTTQVRADGIGRSFVTTYAGYLHLIPRAVAAFASLLPLTATPPVYAVAAAFVAAGAAAIAGRCCVALGMAAPWAWLVGATVLILPSGSFETVLSLFCVEWYCLVAFVVFVAAWLGGYRPPLRWLVPLVLVAGLTSPLLWLTLPFVVPVAWVRRRRLDVALAGTVIVATSAQVIARLSSPTPGAGHVTLIQMARYYSVRVVGGAFGGARFVRDEWERVGAKGLAVAAVVIVAALAVAYLRAHGEFRLVGAYLLTSSVLFLVMEILFRPRYFEIVLPAGFNVMDGHPELWDGRYFVVPGITLFLATCLVLDRTATSTDRPGLRRLASVVGIVLALVVALNFPAPDLHRVSLANYEAQVRVDRSACLADHGSHGVVITYGPFATDPKWALVLTCRQAFG